MTSTPFIVFAFTMATGRVVQTDPVPARGSGSDERLRAEALSELEESFVRGELLHLKQDGVSVGINTRYIVTVDVEVVHRDS